MPFTGSTVKRNLKKKGFEEDSSRDHVYLLHSYKGKRTGPYTKVSHGAGNEDIGPNLVRSMKAQLSLDSHKQVDDLVNCPMTAEQYITHLKGKGTIKDEESKPEGTRDAQPAKPAVLKPRRGRP
ncbi:MAG TPA: hypothetical protein VHY19_01180 [Steroidobacteraceae bacterium]|jgi:hypothetical protein|nr:hypothetical protein [Steroidobacteraceae bacterium]